MGESIIIIPDSFKGSMSSSKVADIIEAEAKRFTNCDCIKYQLQMVEKEVLIAYWLYLVDARNMYR